MIANPRLAHSAHPDDQATLRAAFVETYPFIPWEQRYSCEDWAHKTRHFEALWSAATAAERSRCCGLIFAHCDSDNAAQRAVDAIRGTPGRKRHRPSTPPAVAAQVPPAPPAVAELSPSIETAMAQVMALLPDLGGSAAEEQRREAARSGLAVIIHALVAGGKPLTYHELGGLLATPAELRKLADTLLPGATRSALLDLLHTYARATAWPSTDAELDMPRFNSVFGVAAGRILATALAVNAAQPS